METGGGVAVERSSALGGAYINGFPEGTQMQRNINAKLKNKRRKTKERPTARSPRVNW